MAVQHTASFVMTRLIWKHAIEEEDILRFMRQNFDSISTNIAVTYSIINDKTNLIETSQMEREELEMTTG